MIPQYRMLQKVKTLREERALRELRKARDDLRQAEERLQRLTEEVEESRRTLPERERAVFAEVIDKIVGVPDIDAAKERVRGLQDAHQRLKDKVLRAREHCRKMEAAVEAARLVHREKQAEVEKIVTLTDEMVATAAREALEKEEAEIEDLFSKPVKRPDGEAA